VYTKTILDEAAISDWARSDSPKNHLYALRQEAILILRKGDWTRLSDALPFSVREQLKDDLSRRRMPYRLVEELPGGLSRMEPEVILGADESQEGSRPYRCRLFDFVDSPPVQVRSRIRSGGHDLIGNRDDFWELCLSPVIDALPEEKRLIDYFDQYAFSDAGAALQSQDARNHHDSGSFSGLGWLVRRIDSHVVDCGTPLTFRIHTEVEPGSSRFTADDIRASFEAVFAGLQLENVSLEVLSYDLGAVRDVKLKQKVRVLRDAMHSRTLLFNRRANFSFNYGLRVCNLAYEWERRSSADKTAGNWSWRPDAELIWHTDRFPAAESLRDYAHILGFG
jgi:hypothetical protein